MSTIESVHSDFVGQLLRLLSFNKDGTLLYFYQERHYFFDSANNANGQIYKIFMASVYGGSVREIGEIDVPCFTDPTFDVEKEEIYWLGKVSRNSPEFPPILEQVGSCLLILVIFGVSTGAVTRFYHLSDVNGDWMPMRFSEDDKLLAFPYGTNDDLNIYSVSHMDTVKGTFELNPYIILPFYNTLENVYNFPPNLGSFQNRITVINVTKPGQIMYFKFDTSNWVWESFHSETTKNEFQGFRTFCVGSIIVEALENGNQLTFRVLKAEGKKECEFIYQTSAPPGDLHRTNRFRLSSDGKSIAFLVCQNSRLSISLRTSRPCKLQESCINVVWLRCRQNNDQLTDYEIGDLLGLSTLVNLMDLYFGKRFLTSRVEIPDFYNFTSVSHYGLFDAFEGDVMNEVDDNESIFMDEISDDGGVFMDDFSD